MWKPDGHQLAESGGSGATVAADLLARLEDLVVEYASLAEPERTERLNRDAYLVTAEVARALDLARRRLSALPVRSVDEN